MSEPTCSRGGCAGRAEFYGPLRSEMAAPHGTTAPAYTCVEHADDLAIARVVGWPVSDQPPTVPKCPGCLLNAYEHDKGTVMRRGRRWHWSCIPRVRT